MIARVQTHDGEYSAAVEAQPMRPIGELAFVAKVVRIFRFDGPGPATEVPVPVGTGLHEHYGVTADEAEGKAAIEFREWAQAQKRAD